MLAPVEAIVSENWDWQQLCKKLNATVTLTTLVLAAWQMALGLAKAIVEQQLTERAQFSEHWGICSVCGTRLVSKGFAKRQMLTLVGHVEWKRRVGRCPHGCLGSQKIPFDVVLGIHAYQQTSTELVRLGCLLAVFLPFDLAARMLQQLTGIAISDDTIWNWVQIAGQEAVKQLKLQLQRFADKQPTQLELLDETLASMPLIIAADGVTVPFRSQAKTPKGKITWREIKVGLLTRLGKHQTKTGKLVTQLHQRRLVAVLGDINALKPRLQLEAWRQGITCATQVVWISDGARVLATLPGVFCSMCTWSFRFLSCRPTFMASCKRLSRRQPGSYTSAMVCPNAPSTASRIW